MIKKWIRIKGKLLSLALSESDVPIFDAIERQDGLTAAFWWWKKKYKK